MKVLKIRDILIIGIAVLLTGCSSDDITTGGFSISDEWEIKPGDPVMFTTNVYGKVGTTRTVTYEPVGAGYTFTYFMYKSGDPNPIVGSTVYWPDINTNEYGFIAKTGTLDANGEFADLSADQKTEAKLINEDQLLGYGAVSDENKETLHYRTATDWKNANATDGVAEPDQKNIRLYMQHRRAKITIILKAGVGVLRSDLTYPASGVSVKIYSYKGATPTTTEITPYASSANIDYTASDYGGAAASVATTKYQAIVDPYDYRTGEGKNIAQITVGGRTFTYKPSNDSSEDKSAYNLAAGQHLTITITLTATN